MMYKIQGTIYFRSDDGLMWLDEDASVTLTETTGRLLKFLLDHREHVIYRNEILEKVWDAHGLRTSSHSLNKYISDLRAVFRNLGCTEEIIVTVPRVGFMISAAIVIERMDYPALAVNDESEGEGAVVGRGIGSNEESETYSAGRVKKARYALLALCALVMLFLSIQGELYRPLFAADEDEIYSLGSVDSCPVRTFNVIPQEQKPKMMALAQKLIKKQGMLCSGNSVFYFNVSESVLKASEARVFLAHCINSKVKKGDWYSCENYYRPDYEIPG